MRDPASTNCRQNLCLEPSGSRALEPRKHPRGLELGRLLARGAWSAFSLVGVQCMLEAKTHAPGPGCVGQGRLETGGNRVSLHGPCSHFLPPSPRRRCGGCSQFILQKRRKPRLVQSHALSPSPVLSPLSLPPALSADSSQNTSSEALQSQLPSGPNSAGESPGGVR